MSKDQKISKEIICLDGWGPSQADEVDSLLQPRLHPHPAKVNGGGV